MVNVRNPGLAWLLLNVEDGEGVPGRTNPNGVSFPLLRQSFMAVKVKQLLEGFMAGHSPAYDCKSFHSAAPETDDRLP